MTIMLHPKVLGDYSSIHAINCAVLAYQIYPLQSLEPSHTLTDKIVLIFSKEIFPHLITYLFLHRVCKGSCQVDFNEVRIIFQQVDARNNFHLQSCPKVIIHQYCTLKPHYRHIPIWRVQYFSLRIILKQSNSARTSIFHKFSRTQLPSSNLATSTVLS